MKKTTISIIFLLISLVSLAQSASIYEESFTMPKYDPNNSSMMLIKTVSDWSQINNPNIRFFFVSPGDYSQAGDIKLSANGTSQNRRYIVLYNGNDTHPGKLPLNTSNLAKAEFLITGSYWIIDRMSFWNRGNAEETNQIKGGSFNIINRYFQSNVGGACVTLYKNSHNNTIQNSRVERKDFKIDGQVQQDRAAFQLFNNYEDNISIKNTKILNNETSNFNDGFQTIRQGTTLMNINYEGTIVDFNCFYIDNRLYTNGNGVHDSNGSYAYAENAIDLKVGSENSSNPMIISNNKMWGFRKADGTMSDLDDPGACIAVHYNVNNTIIENNLIWDSRMGFNLSDPRTGYSMRNSTIKNNIFHSILEGSIAVYDASNLIFDGNLNKESGINKPYNTYYFETSCSNISLINNLSVNTYDQYGIWDGDHHVSPKNNEYYRSKPLHVSDKTDIIHPVDPTALYKDLIFTADSYTNNPRVITIPKVLKNSSTSQINPDAGKDQTICAGSSTTLTASGGSVYKWSTGATTKSITVSPGATTTYSVTVSEGASSGTDQVLVTVNALPVANAGANVTIETGQSTTLTASGGDTYLWSNGATSASITVNPTATSTYEVTVTKNGCTSKDSVTVTVNGGATPPPTVTADAGKDQTICAGSSTTLTASGGSVYKWSTGATTKSITVSPGATTTYSVTVSEGASSGTDQVLVTVNALPVANAGANVTIETGQSTTLTASGGDTYLWSNGATSASITVNPTATSTYEVTVTKNGCTSKDSVTVTVNGGATPPPTVTADAGKDQTICAGSSTTLTASGGSVYKWSTGATTKSITVSPGATTTYSVTVSEGASSGTDQVLVTVNALPVANAGANVTIETGQSTTLTASGGDTYLWSNGATSASITVNPTATSTYEVTVTKNGCTSKDSVTVTVNGGATPPPTVTADAGKDQTICAGSSTTLTASGGSVYKWSTGATTKSITVSPGATTTYSVTVSEGASSGTDQVIVTVNALPVANAGADVTIETGQSTTLTASGGDTYLWSNGATSASITVNPTATTTYEVTVNKNGCTSKDAVTVTVNVLPPADANAGSDMTICKGESITLKGDGGTTYSWSTGATSQNITVSPKRTTTYTLTANRGGTTNTDEVTVTVINCNLNNGVNNSVSGTTGNTAANDNAEQDDVQILNKADFELTVYPNPTDGKINVQTTVPIYNFNLVLMNINGNVIYSDEMDATEDGINKEIDLSRFAKGVYLLQLYNGEESYVKKVIVI